MPSSQPLSSNPGAQNTTSQQFHEKPPQLHTNGTTQPPPPSQAIRQRHQQGNSSHGVSQRDHNYNTPIGGYRSSSSDDATTYRSRDPHHYKRRQIRHRLHQKHKQDGVVPIRVGWTKWMHSEAKNHTVAFMGEFVGTFMFLFFAFAGTQVANIGVGDSTNQSTTGSATGFNPATLLYISLSFGFSLMVNAWIFFRISGGLFNPAVTLALALLRALSPLRAVLLFIAQVTGATFSAYIVSVLFPTAFNVRTTLASGTSIAQGLFIEAVCTAELVFTIIMLAGEKHRATFIAPVGIGLALFISELVAVYYTGGSLNPARSFAPCAVTHDFDSEHWIYWLGPFIGALLAVGFYKLNKILEYEMVNPGQDGDAQNDPTQNPEHEVAQAVEERAIEVEEIQAVEEQGGFDNLSTEGSMAGLDPAVMEADPVADLDRHIGGAETTTISGVHKEDIEAQWPRSAQHEGR
ncbi:aquaporin-like protein [Cadophora sp. MPI-SDFR-AT-0126]|nr:aquaporin-like protein [Leotiomycetes sp. MPI-SDFR-AT-0126]